MRDIRCLDCKYHSSISGREGENSAIACLYAAYSRKGSALKRIDGVGIVDSRGKVGEPCMLFEQGAYERPRHLMGRAKTWDGKY